MKPWEDMTMEAFRELLRKGLEEQRERDREADRFSAQQKIEHDIGRFGAEGEEVTEIFDAFMQSLRRRYERDPHFANVEHYAGVLRLHLARLT